MAASDKEFNLDKMLEGLTDSQQEAVKTLDKNLEIIACAGAGKTKTITLRIINLIASGVKPENIVAITFTRKAAAEMKARIYKAGEDYLGNTVGFAGMYIGTIDSFCLKMLQENIPQYAKFSILDEVQTKVFMERYFRRNDSDPTGLYNSAIDLAYNLNKSYRHPEQYAKKINHYTAFMSMLNNCYFDKNSRRNWSADILRRLNKYNECLKSKKYFDFSSLIREMIEYLDPDSDMNGGTMPEFARKIFDKVKYLIIDEYQDTNPSQEYLVELFHKYGHANLCAVGDDDQTIYQFRGSDDSNILGFEEKYNAKKISLDLDFRSTEAVIDIALKSITKNHIGDNAYSGFTRGIIDGSSLEYEKGDTVYSSFYDFQEESAFITERIRELNASGIPYSEIAVLFRKRKKTYFGNTVIDFQDVLARKLSAEGIPCITEGLNNLSTTPEYKASLETFRYIDKQFRNLRAENVTALGEDVTTAERQDVVFGNPGLAGLNNEEKLIYFWKKIDEERGEENLTQGIEEAVEMLHTIDYSTFNYGHEFNMQQIFQDFIGHLALIEKEGNAAQTVMYNLGKFSKVIADYELLFFKESPSFKISMFINHLYKVVPDLYPEGELDNTYIRGDAVRLMTIHQSKGLEFTAVFIPGLTQDMFPGEWDGKGKEDVIYGPMDVIDSVAGDNARRWIPNYDSYRRPDKECGHYYDAERKLFYVAVTRAKKYLFLTSGRTYGEHYDSRAAEYIPIHELDSIFLHEAKESAYLTEYNTGKIYGNSHLPRFTDEPIPITLNFSLLSNYYDCPYRFKLSNFYGFVQPYTSAQGYGTVLHEIMMHIHNAWIEGKTLTKEEIDAIATESMYLPFASEPQIEKSLVGAKKCAHAYVKQNERDADKIIASELEINIEMGDGVSVNGRIDLVRKIDKDGKEKTAIVDLKSAGKDAEQCLNAEQLKIYALGYEGMTGEPADYLMIYNLDHPDGSKNASEPVDRNVLIEIEKSVNKAANCIRNSELPRQEGCNCDKCYVRGLCKKKTS